MKSNLRLLYFLIILTGITGAMWWFDSDGGNILADDQTDFSISDTSLVDKIFIADNYSQVTLERVPGERLWSVNGGEMKANKASIDLLLKTFSRIEVKGAVPEKQRETVIRNLAGSAKKVEIYTGGDKPEKTWYVGTSTSNHTGTFMLLETEEGGRASEPFITHLGGGKGYLTTRFFTDLDEWRYTGIFEYPNRTLQAIEFTDYEHPYNSYKLVADTLGGLKLFSTTGAEVAYRDTISVQNQFLRYKKVYFESWNSRLTEAGQDSLRNTPAKFSIKCTDVDGVSKGVDVYERDEEYLYGIATNENKIVLLQKFHFDPLLTGIQPMLKE